MFTDEMKRVRPEKFGPKHCQLSHTPLAVGLRLFLACGCWLFFLTMLAGAETPPPAKPAGGVKIDFFRLLQDGGAVGYIIICLSVALLALIVEHIMNIRRKVLMPDGLADEIHQLLLTGQIRQAEHQCQQQPSFLGYLLKAGLGALPLGFPAVEKALEDASAQQAARLFRKIEYLNVIGVVAPMLGLLGTVWGMILAFMEFEAKANPQVSELAPGIYGALVTTLQGLSVAIPSVAAYAYFRNRVDELVAQASLLAEHVFSAYRQALLQKKSQAGRQRSTDGDDAGQEGQVF